MPSMFDAPLGFNRPEVGTNQPPRSENEYSGKDISPLFNAGINASFNASKAGQGHHPVINPLMNAVTGQPTKFEGQNGSITVGPDSLTIQGPNVGFDLNQGGIGGSYRTDDGKTSVNMTVNPYEKGNFGAQVGFSHGGVDHTPVPTKFHIEGLDKPSAQAESPQETAAQIFLKNQINQTHQRRVKANPSWYKKPSIN
jgi:hypothetical protein